MEVVVFEYTQYSSERGETKNDVSSSSTLHAAWETQRSSMSSPS